jgi:hypothetical protein
MVNLKVLVKAEFDTRNSDEPVSAVYSAEDMLSTQFLLRSTLLLSSH